MEFHILGPLEVMDQGRVVKLGGSKQRSLLAYLLLRPNEAVSRDRLIDELWGDQPPDTAATAIQVYVSQLRKALGRDVIVTQPPGYLIQVRDGELDLERFERSVAGARSAPSAEASELLSEALALWRGPPLAELDAAFARAAGVRLDEQRLAALEQRIDADLALGRHAQLVPELEGLVREHPLREHLRGQLMVALYRSGRQAEALDVYRTGRRMLDEELGLEPGEELRRLERAILSHDPSLEPPVVAAIVGPSLAQRRAASGQGRSPVPPDSVAVIDPERSEAVGHVPVGRRPVALAVGHGSLWVANADDGTVSRIDPDHYEVVRTIGIGAPAIDLAVAADAVWVANGSDGTVSRIDPNADAVVETIDLRGSSDIAWNPAYAVAADSEAVWIAAGPHHTVRVDPATNEPVALIDVLNVPVGVALGEGALWVVTVAERLVRLEPEVNALTAEVAIGYPIALTAGARALWVSDSRGRVWQIDPETTTVTHTISVSGGLVGLCATDTTLWGANNAQGTLVRINPEDGLVVGTVPVGHAPTDVATCNGLVWVSVQAESAM